MDLFYHIYAHVEETLGELIKKKKKTLVVIQILLHCVIKQESSPIYKHILDQNVFAYLRQKYYRLAEIKHWLSSI